jgi:hypothetical protein
MAIVCEVDSKAVLFLPLRKKQNNATKKPCLPEAQHNMRDGKHRFGKEKKSTALIFFLPRRSIPSSVWRCLTKPADAT